MAYKYFNPLSLQLLSMKGASRIDPSYQEDILGPNLYQTFKENKFLEYVTQIGRIGYSQDKDNVFITKPSEVIKILFKTAQLAPKELLHPNLYFRGTRTGNIRADLYTLPSSLDDLQADEKLFVSCWMEAREKFYWLPERTERDQLLYLEVVLSILFNIRFNKAIYKCTNNLPITQAVQELYQPGCLDFYMTVNKLCSKLGLLVCACANSLELYPSNDRSDLNLYRLRGDIYPYIIIYVDDKENGALENEGMFNAAKYYKAVQAIPGISLAGFGAGAFGDIDSWSRMSTYEQLEELNEGYNPAIKDIFAGVDDEDIEDEEYFEDEDFEEEDFEEEEDEEDEIVRNISEKYDGTLSLYLPEKIPPQRVIINFINKINKIIKTNKYPDIIAGIYRVNNLNVNPKVIARALEKYFSKNVGYVVETKVGIPTNSFR